MSSSSPKPIAHRAFSALVAVLLVGGLVAPIASQPAAAQLDTDTINIEEDCGAAAKFAFPRTCHAAEALFPEVDNSTAKIDVHTGMQGVYQGLQSRDQTYRNYLNDTETLASLEARNAIADAYESNMTAVEAQAEGQKAINDYYAEHQRQLLESFSADTQQMYYYANITQNDPDIDDGLIHLGGVTVVDSQYDGSKMTGKTNLNYTLLTSKEHEYTAPIFYIDGQEGTYNTVGNKTFSHANYNHTAGHFRFRVVDKFDNGDFTGEFTGAVNVMNVPEASLEPQTVNDIGLTYDRLEQIKQQANRVQDNYDPNAAEDLYAAMDAGKISPNDVRGAEGMVRYQSGADDNNVTREALNYALRSTLDLQSGDLNNTMTVHFDGATERTRNASTGNISYTGHVNKTYEGLLFSSEVPSGGFEAGQTYNVSNLNGTTTMVYNGGADEAIFYRGNLTIQAIYDQSGNEIQNVTWSDPKYDTYSSDEFIAALQNASAARAVIVERSSDGGSGGGGDVSLPNPFGGSGPGGAIVGLVIVAAAVGVVVLVVIRP